MIDRKGFVLLCFVLLLSGACNTGSHLASNDRDIYRPDKQNLHPEYVIYHITDSTSRLYFRVDVSDLLYARQEDSEDYYAKLRIKITLFPSMRSAVVLDTASNIIFDKGEPGKDQNRKVFGYLSFKSKEPGRKMLLVEMEDVFRRSMRAEYLVVERNAVCNAQDYLLIDAATNTPAFSPFVQAGKHYKLQCNPEITQLSLAWFGTTFPPAPPPFSIQNYQLLSFDPDSTAEIPVHNGFCQLPVVLKGRLFITPDIKSKKGFTVFAFNQYFPDIKRVDDMIPPLRYITTRKEFDAITTAKDQKAALDQFWIKNCGGPDRARDVLKQFYTRVKNANIYFSSHLEGWKSDRGMVYVVFGPPNVVYRSDHGENWVYGEEGNFMSLSFSFERIENPFSSNDFQLTRTPVYKTNWYRAVDSWRSGRVFTIR